MTSTLDRLLTTLDVRLHAFAVCEVRPGWRLVFEPMGAVVVHYVLAGAGELRVGLDAPPVGLAPHVMAIVPPGRGQTLAAPGGGGSPPRDAPAGSSCSMPADGLVKFDAGAGAAGLLVACGTITATHGGAFGLFDALPGALAEDLEAAEPLRHAFGLMLAELARPGIGTKALTEALMKQCLVLLLRRQLARGGGEGSPLLAALPDPRLARAVALVLEAPAAAHTLAGLAAAAGMSRSSFAERFAAAFGQSPLDFVRRVRLREAARLLGATELPVKVIAASVGYASRSRFSSAFRDAYGLDPTAFRASASGAGEIPFPAAPGPAPSRSPTFLPPV